MRGTTQSACRLASAFFETASQSLRLRCVRTTASRWLATGALDGSAQARERRGPASARTCGCPQPERTSSATLGLSQSAEGTFCGADRSNLCTAHEKACERAHGSPLLLLDESPEAGGGRYPLERSGQSGAYAPPGAGALTRPSAKAGNLRALRFPTALLSGLQPTLCLAALARPPEGGDCNRNRTTDGLPRMWLERKGHSALEIEDGGLEKVDPLGPSLFLRAERTASCPSAHAKKTGGGAATANKERMIGLWSGLA